MATTVGFGQEGDRVSHAEFYASQLCAIDQLQKAAGIAGRDDRGAGALDVLELALQELVGHPRLDEIVDAGAAAAPVALGQFDEPEAGD